VISEANATIPPNVVRVRLDILADTPSGVSVSGTGLFRTSGVTLIQDGAISSHKLAAASVTGDKIMGNTITGDKVVANTITGDKIQAGSVSANVLTSGVGAGNLVYNAALTATFLSGGLPVPDGLTAGSDFNLNPYTFCINGAGPSMHPVGVDVMSVCQRGTASTDNQYVISSPMPVVPGAWYEGSIYTGAHRCEVSITIGWGGANGAWIGFSKGTSNAQEMREMRGRVSLSDYHRLFVLDKAPPGALTAQLLTYKSGTLAGENSWMFICMPYFGVANGPNQTQPSAWSPPGIGTQIHGGAIKTSTITADRLAVTELSAITANIGLLRSAVSGARFELSTTGLVVYDANGVDRVRVGYLP
jgi:hypothetical protein